VISGSSFGGIPSTPARASSGSPTAGTHDGALPLTLACWDYDRTRALQDGRVRPEGIELTYLPLMMIESFSRMLRFGEFGASEMSLSWYTRTVTAEVRPFVAIPVFPSRMFRHSSIYVHVDSGIDEPGDLIGKRVGCPEYQMTAAVWVRGIMAEHHGVPVESVTYFIGGLEQAGPSELPMGLPGSIVVRPIDDDQTLSAMLDAGQIDALYTPQQPSSFTNGSKNVRRLFEDHRSVEQAYFVKTGIFPIMHVVVVRQDVYEAHPWVARSLVKAFDAAKRLAESDLFEMTAHKIMLPWLTAHAEETKALLGADFWPYGIERNRHTLQVFLGYAWEQGLLSRPLRPDELFAPETTDVNPGPRSPPRARGTSRPPTRARRRSACS
jgi:4,5-dihydroxyphthalate decarboxylase